MANLSLKAAKNRKLDLKTKIQAVKDPDLRASLMDMLSDVDVAKATAAEFQQIEESLKAVATMPAGSPVPAPERAATEADLEAAKKNLEGGAAAPAPKAEAPKVPRTKGIPSEFKAMNINGEPQPMGGVFNYVRVSKDMPDGSVKIYKTVLHGNDEQAWQAQLKKYLAQIGVEPKPTGVEGQASNILIRKMTDPTIASNGKPISAPINVEQVASRYEAEYQVQSRAERKADPTKETLRLQTEDEAAAYKKQDEAFKTERATKERTKGKTRRGWKNESGSEAAGSTKEAATRGLKAQQAASAENRLKMLEKVSGGQVPENVRKLVLPRLSLAPEELEALPATEQAALKRMENQLMAGNFEAAGQTASAIPIGSVEKVAAGGARKTRVPEGAPRVTGEGWQDPKPLAEKISKLTGTKAEKLRMTRELRVQHLFETGAFNTDKGDDLRRWITEKPEAWSKLRADPNAMKFLEQVGTNRGVMAGKVMAVEYDSLLNQVNYAVGKNLSVVGGDTSSIRSLQETRGRAFFDTSGRLKKNLTRIDKATIRDAKKQETFETARGSNRLAELEKKGTTVPQLEKRVANYEKQLSKLREKNAPESDVRQIKARLDNSKKDLELLKNKAAGNVATSQTELKTGLTTRPAQLAGRSYEEQIATAEAELEMVKKGYHPQWTYKKGDRAGKPVRLGKNKESLLAQYTKRLEDLRARAASSAEVLAKATAEEAAVAAAAAAPAAAAPTAPAAAPAAAAPTAPAAAPAAAAPTAPAAAAAAETGGVAAATAETAAATSGLPNPYKGKKTGWKPNPARDKKQLIERAKQMGMRGGGMMSKAGGLMRFLGPLAAIYGGYTIVDMLKQGTIDEADARRLKAMEALGAVGGGMQQDIGMNEQIRGMQRMVDMAAIQRQQRLDDMRSQYTGNQALDAILQGQQASLSALAQPSRPSIAEMMARM